MLSLISELHSFSDPGRQWLTTTNSIMHAYGTQSGAEYGLAISSEQGELSTSDQNTYYYADGAGSGVYVYVIDTGINTGHSDFGGRASMIANYISGSPDTDENGHGTHCKQSFDVLKCTGLLIQTRLWHCWRRNVWNFEERHPPRHQGVGCRGQRRHLRNRERHQLRRPGLPW